MRRWRSTARRCGPGFRTRSAPNQRPTMLLSRNLDAQAKLAIRGLARICLNTRYPPGQYVAGGGLFEELSLCSAPRRVCLSRFDLPPRLARPVATFQSLMGVTTPFPNPDAIARAELFTRERFVYDGETLEEALSPGSARRRALDAALTEVQAGHLEPSIEWRRRFSLLLGLERLLSEEEPHLADGTAPAAHH